LSLAAIYMKAFTEKTRSLSCGAIHTGAGICIVKVHYPFRRAYEMSASLASEAKALLGENRRTASALDWHISTTGLSGGLGQLRRQEYTSPEGSLLMRPVWLSHEEQWRTLDNFNQLVAHFNYDERWAGRRNKLKDLREVLRAGADSVREFLGITRFPGRKIPNRADGQKPLSTDRSRTGTSFLPKVLNDDGRHLEGIGWESDRCVYFDALEAMDHHILLEEVRNAD